VGMILFMLQIKVLHFSTGLCFSGNVCTSLCGNWLVVKNYRHFIDFFFRAVFYLVTIGKFSKLLDYGF
jgi:hypothetical protein